jgi:preprotein translocase subunit SecD
VNGVPRTENLQNYLETGWYEISYDGSGILMNLDRSDEAYHIIPNPVFTNKDFTELYIYETDFGTTENPNYGLAIILKDELTGKWSDLTEKSIGKQLAFIIDNQLIATPMVNSRINYSTTAINRMEYSKSDLEDFMNQIKSN